MIGLREVGRQSQVKPGGEFASHLSDLTFPGRHGITTIADIDRALDAVRTLLRR